MNGYRILLSLLLGVWLAGSVYACDCQDKAAGMLLAAFNSKPHTKAAAWEEPLELWGGAAAQGGWQVTTAPLAAEPGMLLIGRGAAGHGWGAIVRAVEGDVLTLDYVGEDGRWLQQKRNAAELRHTERFIAAIWPKPVQ